MVNNKQEFFEIFSEGQLVSEELIETRFGKFEESEDLHIEKYGASQQEEDILELGEDFIVVWKDTGNSSCDYKGNYKVSFMLSDMKTGVPIYKCIFKR